MRYLIVLLGLTIIVSATNDSHIRVHPPLTSTTYGPRAADAVYDVPSPASDSNTDRSPYSDSSDTDPDTPESISESDSVINTAYWPAAEHLREADFVLDLFRSLIEARNSRDVSKTGAASPAVDSNASTVTDAASAAVSLSTWSGFHRKPISERHDLLSSYFPQLDRPRLLSGGGLPIETADSLIENCIGTIGIPIGVAPTFVINDRHHIIPMATEEPSIIAAANGAAKLIAASGAGFRAQSTSNMMIGQIQLIGVTDFATACATLHRRKAELLAEANRFCASMVRRGGGVLDLEPRIVPQRNPDLPPRSFFVVHVHMDVRDAMGANAVNTVCEGLGPALAEACGARVGLRILSNYCLERRVRSEFRLPLTALSWKGFDGRHVAERLVDAYELAEADPYRAVTHNKGVMNGIDAVAVATGQDWRAIEAAAHAYAARRGYYGSLTRYQIDGDVLVGEIEMPMAVGTVGGSIRDHRLYAMAMGLLGHPSAEELGQILASVGLAQNFAALRALATEGIQRGHMLLHCRKASFCNTA